MKDCWQNIEWWSTLWSFHSEINRFENLARRFPARLKYYRRLTKEVTAQRDRYMKKFERETQRSISR